MGKYSFAKANDPDWDIVVTQRLKSQIKLHIFSETLARKPREKIFERVEREIQEFLNEIDNEEIRASRASELNSFAQEAYEMAKACIGNMTPYVFALSLADPSTLTDRQKRLVGASKDMGGQIPTPMLQSADTGKNRLLGTTKSPDYQNRFAVVSGGFGVGLSNEAATKIAKGFEKLPPPKTDGYSYAAPADTYYPNVHKRNKELITDFAELTAPKNYIANVNPRAWAEMNARYEKYLEEKQALISRGVRLVYVPPHSNCSKRCQPYQSRLYSLDGTSGTIDGKSYIPIEDASDNVTYTSKATGRKYYAGLFSYNCRHTMREYERGMQFEYIPADVIEKTRKLEMIQRKMEREIRMEKEKTALYMIVYKQSKNESVHKQEIAFRKNATAMRKQLESFCRANGLVYYPDRIKIMEGEDIYLRTKGKNDKIALSAKINSDINSKDLTNDQKSVKINLQFFASKEKQFGKKVGKHAIDFGLDPSKAEDREKFQNIIDDIVENKEELRIGAWRGQQEEVLFHIRGDDVVITDQNNEFITVLKGGINNARVKNSRNK